VAAKVTITGTGAISGNLHVEDEAKIPVRISVLEVSLLSAINNEGHSLKLS
jgi:hypothetical protein